MEGVDPIAGAQRRRAMEGLELRFRSEGKESRWARDAIFEEFWSACEEL